MTALLDPVPDVAAPRKSADNSSSQVGRTGPVSRSSHGVPPATFRSDRDLGGPPPSIKDPPSHIDPLIHSSADPLEDLAHEFAKDSPNVFLKAAINIASMDFFTVLNRFDTGALIKRLKEKPELYFPLINSFATLMKVWLERDKFEHRQKQAAARQRERDQKLRARKPILITSATISSIHLSVGRGVPVAPPSNVAASRKSADHLSSPPVGRSVPVSRPQHVVPPRPCGDGPFPSIKDPASETHPTIH